MLDGSAKWVKRNFNIIILSSLAIYEKHHAIMEWFPFNFRSNTPQLPVILIG